MEVTINGAIVNIRGEGVNSIEFPATDIFLLFYR